MGTNSAIEWTDHTFNPWTGCTKIGPGCDHCYAEGWAKRSGIVQWGSGAERRRTSAANWRQPLRWNAQAQRLGIRYRVFCASLADVFDNAVPAQWRAELFDLISRTPHLDWLLVTKRIGNAKTMMADALHRNPAALSDGRIWPLPNVWLGVSTERQQEADERIPDLLQTPAAVRFISTEPLLGPIDLTGVKIDFMPGYFGDALQPHHVPYCDRHHRYPKLDWVIVGGESGPGARPMHPDWARGLRDQCATAGVPFFFKQWGAYRPNFPQYADEFGVEEGDMLCDGYEFPAEGVLYRDGHFYDGVEYQPHTGVGAYWMSRAGKKAAGRHLDGKLHDEFPTRENCNGV